MKVQMKSVLKSHFHKIRLQEENQIVYPAGNNMYVTELGKSEGQFISLGKQNCHLYDFAVSPNYKHIFTAEKTNTGIQICSYSMTNDRKTIKISQQHNYMPLQLIEAVQLLTDQFQSSILYVITKSKTQACITLIDMLKTKVICSGFVSDLNQAFVFSEENHQLSVSGRGFLRRLKAVDSTWQVQQKIPKKLINIQFNFSRYLPLGRVLAATKTIAYIITQTEVLQTHTITTQQDPIHQIIKISNGFVCFSQKGTVKLFCQQGEDGLYFLHQQLRLDMEKGKIVQVQFNKKTDQMIVVSSTGKFYHSKLQEISSNSNKQNHFNFQEIDLNYSQPINGSICTTPGQNYCLISSDRSVQLWDLKKLCQTIKLQFNNMDQDKVVKTSAINPDGHSICIGFSDRIKFYRILLNKFRQFGQYSIKNAILIQYSHGGQLVAVIYGKGINSFLSIINTLNLREVSSFKLGFKPAQVVWNQHDDQVYVSGQDTKILNIYQISSKSKKNSIHFNGHINFIRFDYLTRKLMVSCQSQIHLIDSDQKSQSKIKPNIPNFDYVFPVEGMYLGTDKFGGLYCSNTVQFQKYHYISIFTRQKFNLIYRKGIVIAYSSPGNAFLLRLKNGNQMQNSQVVQNIVLVQKQQINKFFDRIKLLQNLLDQLQTSTALKLEQQRKDYFQSLDEKSRIFEQEMVKLKNSYNEIQSQKIRQQKYYEKLFKDNESGQIHYVNDLQKIYDMKIRLQKQKYLTLQQQNLQQKMKYENIIKGLEEKYQRDTEKTRKQYSQKLANQVKSLQAQKQRQIQYRKKAETKLLSMQQQSEMTIFQVQMSKDTQIKNLIQRHTKLQRQYDSKVIALHNKEEDFNQITYKYNQALQKIKKNDRTVQQNINKVAILQQQIQKRDKIIQEKNQCIQQQAHQIDGLQKAKYVLGFRRIQLRKQLQPKQALIQKLKSQLFKLDQQYKNETKRNFETNQKLQKIQKISQNYKKENAQFKTQLKNKQRIHNNLCSQLYMLVNNSDSKDWNKQIIKIYQNYIHEQNIKHKSVNKDDQTCEQINRHLIHVQQSLHQVATGNQKMLKGKQKQVIRKMKQNSELVYDLNLMRKQQNKLINQNRQKQTKISELKRQIHQYSQIQKSTRANTAVTGTTRRNLKNGNTANSDWVDLSFKGQSGYLIPQRQNSRRGRVLSANKTMLWREDGKKQKSKISDLAKELQSAKNTIMRQDRMIQQLNQRLLGLPQQNYV